MHEFVRNSGGAKGGSLQSQPRQQQRQQQQRRQQQHEHQHPAEGRPGTARGHALSGALFSCMAIGGLMMGSPPSYVVRYLATAKSHVSRFEGLRDRCAVSALILYAMANEFLTGRKAGSEYRKSMDSAKAIFGGLEEKEEHPITSAVLAHFMVLEGFPAMTHVEACSINPVNCSSRGGGGGGGGGGGKNGRGKNGSGVSINANDNGDDVDGESEAAAAAAVAAAAVRRKTPSGGGTTGSSSSSSSSSSNTKSTSYMCLKTEKDEIAFQDAVSRRETWTSRPAPPVYIVVDGEKKRRRCPPGSL